MSAAWTKVLPIAGGTLNGDLAITKPHPNFWLNASGIGEQVTFSFLKDDKARWIVLSNNDAETGSNVGSSFLIGRCSDAKQRQSFLDIGVGLRGVRRDGFVCSGDGFLVVAGVVLAFR
jgi:hypothetical protein